MQPKQTTTPPSGYRYQSDFMTVAEERDLVEWLTVQPYIPPSWRPENGREIRMFGVGYDFPSTSLTPAVEPLPHELEWLTARTAKWAGIERSKIVQMLVNRYQPGCGFDWHMDPKAYADEIPCLSLAAPCTLGMRTRNEAGEVTMFEQQIEPRSIYIITGDATRKWQHRVMPTDATRYSITFRAVT